MIRAFFWTALAALAIVLGASLLVPVARAESKSEWFRSLKVPGAPASSCCDEADCKPTKAEHRDDGYWWAEVDGRMQRVPPERIVRDPVSYDGRAYVCVWQGVILCFIPPGAGS